MDRHMAAALDRHITGNYGEDQYRDYEVCDGCEHDDDETGLCKLNKDPTTCKMEKKESYLQEQADRMREEMMIRGHKDPCDKSG